MQKGKEGNEKIIFRNFETPARSFICTCFLFFCSTPACTIIGQPHTRSGALRAGSRIGECARLEWFRVRVFQRPSFATGGDTYLYKKKGMKISRSRIRVDSLLLQNTSHLKLPCRIIFSRPQSSSSLSCFFHMCPLLCASFRTYRKRLATSSKRLPTGPTETLSSTRRTAWPMAWAPL